MFIYTRGGLQGALVAMALTVLPACAQKGGAVPALAADEIRVTGTVQKTPVGVNCWRFDDGAGKGYELRQGQAPAEALVDGKRLTLVLRRRADLVSNCMVGEIVDVVRIEPSESR